MGEMSPRTKWLILGLIVLGIVLIVASDTQNPNLFPALSFLAIPLFIPIFSFLPKRIKDFVMRYLFLIILGIIITALIILVVKFLRLDLSSALFLVIFWPLLLLVLWVFVLLYLGPILVKSGNHKAAENLYTFMIRFNRDFGYGYLQRGILYHIQKNRDKAFADYDRALEIARVKAALPQPKPFSINYSAGAIHDYKADLYLSRNDPQEAIAECNAGLAVHEDHPTVKLALQIRRGYAQLVMGNYEGALSDFMSIRFEPDMQAYEKAAAPNLHALKALVYQALDRPAEAQAAWQQATALNPKYANLTWLHDTLNWPENLLQLAAGIQTRIITNADTKV